MSERENSNTLKSATEELTHNFNEKIKQINLNHEEKLNTEKQNIKVQFEKLTETFQLQQNEIASQVEKLQFEKSNLETKITELTDSTNSNTNDLKRKLEERIQANKNYQAEISNLEKENAQLKSEQEQLKNDRDSSEIDMKSLNSKVSDYIEQINILEMKRDEHEAEMRTHKKEMEKLIATQKDGDKQVAESEDLKKKLKLSINNAKRLEEEVIIYFIFPFSTFIQFHIFQFSQLDEKLSQANDEKKEIQSQNKKLHKQMDKLKVELDQYSVEAAQASNNPWESEEWEGLTAVEKYQIMKNELVPAQLAR